MRLFVVEFFHTRRRCLCLRVEAQREGQTKREMRCIRFADPTEFGEAETIVEKDRASRVPLKGGCGTVVRGAVSGGGSGQAAISHGN